MEIVQYHLLSNLVWKSELESILEAITAIPDNCLQVGDFNSDLHNLDKGTQDGRTLLDLLDIYDLYNLIDSPTRITKTSISLLDLVITNNKKKISASGVIHLQISDHSLVYAILRKTARKN